jgi:hypothetical protein
MSLERRYQRLLSWYPTEHRAVYEVEMLGVLMDGAGPDRTRPTLRETASLLGNALSAQLRYRRRGLAGPAWRDATAVVSVVAVLMTLAYHLAGLVGRLRIAWQSHGLGPTIPPYMWGPALAWAVVAVAGFAGPRRLAATLGCLALLGDVFVLGREYFLYGLGISMGIRQVPFAVLAAVALAVGGGARRGVRLLRPARAGSVFAACACAVASVIVYHLVAILSTWGTVLIAGMRDGLLVLACVLAAAPVRGPVRRRVTTLLAPLAVLAVLDVAQDAALAERPLAFEGPILSLADGLVLALTGATFLVAVRRLRRYERATAGSSADDAATP